MITNIYSSLAQQVEQAAVNRWVVGSSPTRGAICGCGVTVNISAFQADDTGSIPVIRSICWCSTVGSAADL